jgi:hypothetical protein
MAAQNLPALPLTPAQPVLGRPPPICFCFCFGFLLVRWFSVGWVAVRLTEPVPCLFGWGDARRTTQYMLSFFSSYMTQSCEAVRFGTREVLLLGLLFSLS